MSGASAKAAKISRIRSDAVSIKGVRLIKAFSQILGQELETLKAMDHRGACRALCIQWIIHRHQGKDFWGAMQDQAVFRQIIHQQRSFDKGEKGHGADQEKWIDIALGTADLEIRNTTVAQIVPNIEIGDTTLPFHLYRAKWAPPGAHAMAAHFRGPWVSFFDPNLGHFHCDSKALYHQLLNTLIFPNKRYGSGKTLTELLIREIS